MKRRLTRIDKLREQAYDAARRGDMEALFELIERAGADWDKCLGRAGDGATDGHQLAVFLFLARGFYSNPDHGFWEGVSAGWPELMDVFLQRGANVESRDRQRLTPFLWAAKEGKVETMEHLLLRGADPFALCPPDGESALHLAVQRPYPQAIHLLLACRVPPNQRETRDGYTPLHLIGFDYGTVPVPPMHYRRSVRMLLAAGADIEARDNDGWSPLSLAAADRHPAVVEELVKAGADINARLRDRRTALHLAAHRRAAQNVKCLVEAGAEVNCRDAFGMSPLHVAATHPDCVRILLENAADPALHDRKGNTPLHYAAKEGINVSAELLVRYGAVPNARNRRGRTPCDLAIQQGYALVAATIRGRAHGPSTIEESHG